MNVKNLLFILLVILISTLCVVIILGCVGVAYKLVDAQYVEGLVSGALLTLVMMIIKDLVNGDDGTVISSTPKSTEVKT